MPAALTEITTSFGPGSGVGQEPNLNSCGASKIAAFILLPSSRRASRRWILVLSILPLWLGLDEHEIPQFPGSLDRCNDRGAPSPVRAIARRARPRAGSFQHLPSAPA